MIKYAFSGEYLAGQRAFAMVQFPCKKQPLDEGWPRTKDKNPTLIWGN